jgi:uncharacterized protein (DUF58 family)
MSRWRRAIDTVTAFLPTRRLAVAVALLAPLWLASWWPAGLMLAALATVALVVLAAVDVALLPDVRDLDVEREAPPTLGVGDAAGGRYLVRSHWSRPLAVRMFDALPLAHVAVRGAQRSLVLPPRGSGELSFTLDGRTRGDAPLGDVVLRVCTPIGLVAHALRYHLDDRIVVAPSLAGVRRFRWLAVHQRLAAAGVRDARRRDEGRAFARLRDYVPGDDPRHIDWKATARRGHTITREFTIEQSQTVYVLVDAGRSMTQLAGEFSRFEYALSAALVLADVAASAGDRVGAMVFDDHVRALVPAQRGAAALQAMRAALVPVQPSLAEPDYATAFRVLAQRQRKRSLIVLITDVLEPRAARALLAHLTRGVSRHLAVVVALRNEALLAAAALPAKGSADDVYESAAAAELLAERAMALQRMRDAGVVVLDVAPDAMAAAVVSQYLELKARGVL